MVDDDLAPKDAGTWTVSPPKLLQPKRLKNALYTSRQKHLRKNLKYKVKKKTEKTTSHFQKVWHAIRASYLRA